MFTRYDDDVETDSGEIWLNDTAIVGIIGLPFLTHEKIVCWLYRIDKCISTIRLTTRIVPISDIFYVFGMIDHDGVNSSSLEPWVYHSKVIIWITRVSTMMILPISRRKLYIPVVCCHIETTVIAIRCKSETGASSIVPWEPGTTDTIHIDIGNRCDIGRRIDWNRWWLTDAMIRWNEWRSECSDHSSRHLRMSASWIILFSHHLSSESNSFYLLIFCDLLLEFDIFLHLKREWGLQCYSLQSVWLCRECENTDKEKYFLHTLEYSILLYIWQAKKYINSIFD